MAQGERRDDARLWIKNLNILNTRKKKSEKIGGKRERRGAGERWRKNEGKEDDGDDDDNDNDEKKF